MVALALENAVPGNPANFAILERRLSGVPAPSTRTPLSILAWSADQLAYGEWIKRSDFPEFPWTVSFAGKREAQRRRQLAIARGEPAGSLTERSGEVLRDAVQWCFGDASWCLLLGWIRTCGLQVSGIHRGSRVVIDDLLLGHLIVDLQHDRAMTQNGDAAWHALAIEWPEAAKAEAASSPPRTLQGEFAKWYAGTYPDGHPVGKKHDELAFEAARSLGRKVSARMVRRSLKDFRPRPMSAR